MRSAFSTSSLYHSEKFSCLRPMGSPRMGRGCGSLYKKAGSRVARDAPRPAGPENAMSAKSAKVAKSPFVASLALFALIAFFGPLTREISLDALPSEGQPSRVPEHLVIRAGAALAHGPAPLDDLQRAQVVEAVLAERLVRQLHLRHEGAVGAEVAVAPQGLARGGDGVPRVGHVEDDRVDVALLDALGDIALLDLHQGGEAALLQVAARPVDEVGADLVGEDAPRGRHGPGQRGGERAAADAGLDDAAAGAHVALEEDAAGVLGEDDLRLA